MKPKAAHMIPAAVKQNKINKEMLSCTHVAMWFSDFCGEEVTELIVHSQKRKHGHTPGQDSIFLHDTASYLQHYWQCLIKIMYQVRWPPFPLLFFHNENQTMLLVSSIKERGFYSKVFTE